MSASYYLHQGPLLKLAGAYPFLMAPLSVGCASLAMSYYEFTMGEAAWFVSQILLNVT